MAATEAAANERSGLSLAKLRLAAYFQKVTQADLELLTNNAAAAERALAECDPDLRGWEWRYVRARCQEPLWTFRAAADRATAVALGPDGRHLVVSSGRKYPSEHEPRSPFALGLLREAYPMMRRAVAGQPGRSYLWEVLAVAHLRAGEWEAAITAAAQVRRFERGGRGVDWFVEAIARHRLGGRGGARRCYEQSEAFYRDRGEYERRSRTRYFDFFAFQSEAAATLGLPTPARDVGRK